MIKVNTLSARIALAMLSTVVIGVFILGIVFYFTLDHMEHKLLEMLDSYAQQKFNEDEPGNASANESPSLLDKHLFLKFTSSDRIPKEFKKLDVGFHHDIKLNDRRYHVAVKQYDGVKKYLLFDITDIETQEHIYNTVIAITTAFLLILAIWIAYWLSRKVIRPVQKLADQVENINPDTRNLRIADQYSDVEIGTIARSFDRYMERLDGFVEREQSFTSTASHELRTPLSVISTSIELLEANPDLPDNLKQYIERIKRSSNEMSNLISALLFLAREDQPNNLNLSEHADIALITQNIADTYHYVEKDRGIKLTLTVNQDLYVEAPKSHVQIIINNLIYNAIRYTQQGSVQIIIENNAIKVVDTGIGIDDESLKHVFERGFKGKKSTGHGFGLYICKRICERYDWDISISRNTDKGTTAIVTFLDKSNK